MSIIHDYAAIRAALAAGTETSGIRQQIARIQALNAQVAASQASAREAV